MQFLISLFKTVAINKLEYYIHNIKIKSSRNKLREFSWSKINTCPAAYLILWVRERYGHITFSLLLINLTCCLLIFIYFGHLIRLIELVGTFEKIQILDTTKLSTLYLFWCYLKKETCLCKSPYCNFLI